MMPGQFVEAMARGFVRSAEILDRLRRVGSTILAQRGTARVGVPRNRLKMLAVPGLNGGPAAYEFPKQFF